MKPIRPMLLLPLVIALGGCDSDAPSAPAAAPDARSDARGAVTPKPAAPAPTIVDVAVAVNAASGEFSTLIAAVLRAGLVNELSARGQRTVFAPTDAAFERLGLTAANIDAVPREALTEILLYHVAPGRRQAGPTAAAGRIRMANGGFAWLRLENGTVFINDAQVVAADVGTSNGIIHVIDSVLAP